MKSSTIICLCGSPITFSKCCEPIINKKNKAETAEQLMRSRYTAYTLSNIDYLIATTHPSERGNYSPGDMEKWAKDNDWQGLEIIQTTTNTVEFKAYFIDSKGKKQVHHEKSTFVMENGNWYYFDGVYDFE